MRRYFLRKLRRVKKANGQVIAVNEVRAIKSATCQLGDGRSRGQRQRVGACSQGKRCVICGWLGPGNWRVQRPLGMM